MGGKKERVVNRVWGPCHFFDEGRVGRVQVKAIGLGGRKAKKDDNNSKGYRLLTRAGIRGKGKVMSCMIRQRGVDGRKE